MFEPADDGADELQEVTDRLVTPAEMAEIMAVDETDVLRWMGEGHLESEPGADGSPRIRISEHHDDDSGPVHAGLTFFQTNGGPEFDAEIFARRATRRRERDSEGESEG
jgi:hypothetical protein